MSEHLPFPLEVKNLQKTYRDGSVVAVKDVSFSMNSGEIFGLLGPNGAGKTTTISTITTLEEPTNGSVKVFGVDVTEDPMFTKRQIGVVHQEVINSGFFDIEEILQFHSGYYGIRKNTERIHFLLHKLSLFEHRKKKVKQLSGGMKRRLMIAKALVHNPKLLILDEPTAGVDISLREDLWKFVVELQKDGMSILLTTHYLEEAQELCGRVGIINRGEIVELGNTKDIIRKYTHKKIRLVLNCYRELRSEYLISQDADCYQFVVPQAMTIGSLLSDLKVNSADIIDVEITEGKLEDAFLKLTAKDKVL